MKTAYTHKTSQIVIEVRHAGRWTVAWAHFIDGKYQGTKVLPKNNTAIVQNFGYAAADFA
jgi:hypothetical protein